MLPYPFTFTYPFIFHSFITLIV